MITIDAPISFLLGSGLAYAASKKPDEQYISAVFQKGLLLQSCVLTPVILFFMIRFPDWEWNYLFNAEDFFFSETNRAVGATCIALIAALLNATFVLGFHLSRKLIIQGKGKLVVNMLAGVGGLILIIMLIMLDQTLHIGTLAEFKAGEAPLIFFNRDFLIAQFGAGTLLAAGIYLTLKKNQT